MDEVEIYTVHVDTNTLPVGDTPTWTLYAVIADTEEEAIMKVQSVVPAEWKATRATKGTLSTDLVKKYGLRAGRIHHL